MSNETPEESWDARYQMRTQSKELLAAREGGAEVDCFAHCERLRWAAKGGNAINDNVYLLRWVADRLVNVYGESPNVDFVLALRERASMLEAALSSAAPQPAEPPPPTVERQVVVEALLRRMASQRRTVELDEHERESADYEYAYDEMVINARKALALLTSAAPWPAGTIVTEGAEIRDGVVVNPGRRVVVPPVERGEEITSEERDRYDAELMAGLARERQPTPATSAEAQDAEMRENFEAGEVDWLIPILFMDDKPTRSRNEAWNGSIGGGIDSWRERLRLVVAAIRPLIEEKARVEEREIRLIHLRARLKSEERADRAEEALADLRQRGPREEGEYDVQRDMTGKPVVSEAD